MAGITHAQIEPTTRCNFTCGFCAGRAMAQGDLDWADFTRFLDAHPDLAHVELQGEGEPMLHPRFFDMVDACRARGIRVGLITNGSLLSDERVARLLGAGLASIHVSMESSDPGQFEAIRGGKFAKVRQGLARLVDARRALGLERPVIGLAVTVLRDTLAAVDGICRLYDALGLDGGIVAQPLQTMPAYRRHYRAGVAAQMLPADAMPRFAELRQMLARRTPVRRTEDFFYFSLFAGFDGRACPWLERGAYLAQDGRVTGCCFMKDHSLGSLADPVAIAANRAGLRDALHNGERPTACLGCPIADAVAANHRA